jgi:hypothetical protein
MASKNFLGGGANAFVAPPPHTHTGTLLDQFTRKYQSI